MAEKQQIRFEPDALPPPSVARVAGLGRVPDPIDERISRESVTPLHGVTDELLSGAISAGDASKNLGEAAALSAPFAGVPVTEAYQKAKAVMQNYGRTGKIADPDQPKNLEDLGEAVGSQLSGISGKQLGTKLGQGDIGGAIGDVVPSIAAALLMHKAGAKIKAGMPAPEPELHPASQQISELHAQHGGSTVNLNTGDQIGKHGYAVSLFPERTAALDHPPSPQEVSQFINANQDILQHPNASVGTWHDASTGTHQLDVVGTTRARANAIGHAERYNQKAIFDLHKLEEIPTGGTGEMTDSVSQLAPPVEQRLDSLAAGEPERAPFIGRHFSATAIKNGILSGARRGASGVGQEKNRLTLGNGAEPGVYVYRTGAPGEPMITSRAHEYEVRGNKALANIDENPLWGQAFEGARQQAMDAGVPEGEAFGIALNEAERAMKEEGYDGYFHPAYRNIVFMFGDQDAVPVGEKTKSKMTPRAASIVPEKSHQIVPGNTDTDVTDLKKKYGIPDAPRQFVGGPAPADNSITRPNPSPIDFRPDSHANKEK